MAKIPLRQYLHEIDELIERGHYDQAIAHCRHILEQYPKHVETYRVLGKAYLEKQSYGDATDILERVLSAVPDDFISHVGMSMIREDEGRLEDAIWHMERAFEIQPANNAIQGELRRLYTQRDGVEPVKIRLTRGALARMYLKGNLYAQAVAELRSILTEDASRYDMLVLLARATHLNGQLIEAAEACRKLLDHLPYCLDANRILREILEKSDRSEDAQPYQQRLFALDPYSAHTSPTAPTPDKVPDEAVSLERLDWRSGMTIGREPDQPEWAASLGVKIEDLEPETEEISEWISASDRLEKSEISAQDTLMTSEEGEGYLIPAGEGRLSTESAEGPEIEAGELASADLPPQKMGEGIPTEADVPEWVKEIGWVPATSEAPEVGLIEESETDQALAKELAEAEIPAWLNDLAPLETVAEEEGPSVPEEQISLPEAEGEALPAPGIPEWLYEPAEQPGQLGDEVEVEVSETWPISPEIVVPEEDRLSTGNAEGSFLETTMEGAPSAAPPDWLQGIGEDFDLSEEETKPIRVVPIEPVSKEEALALEGGQIGTGEESPQQEEPSFVSFRSGKMLFAPEESVLAQVEPLSTQVELQERETAAGQVKSVTGPAGAAVPALQELDFLDEEPAVEAEIPDWLKEVVEMEPGAKSSKARAMFGEPAAIQEEEKPTAEMPASEHVVPPSYEVEMPDWLVDIEVGAGAPIPGQSPGPPLDAGGVQGIVEVEHGQDEITAPGLEHAEIPVDIDQMVLIQARNALIRDERDDALEKYDRLIHNLKLLPDVIHDLHEAVHRFPSDAAIWQALGDAYAREGQLDAALDAYDKAAQLLT